MTETSTEGEVTSAAPRAIDDPRLFQALIAEQSSLMAARAMNQTEMASRASMFVAALSGSIVALAFVAQASRFGIETVAFGLMLLPVTLFLGLTTFIRAVDLATEEVRWVAALNKVRSGYVEALPVLAEYFTTFRTETRAGVVATLSPVRQSMSTYYGLATTPGVLAVLDAVLAAAIGGTIVVALAGSLAVALVVVTITFAVVLALQAT